MTKNLKQFLEVYRPKAQGEQNFVDKHVTIKHKDRNGNGDDVFKASNIKTSEREGERHGHSSGNDEKVYEDVEIYRLEEGQKPYVSMSGNSADVLDHEGKSRASFTKSEHGVDYKKKAIAHLEKNYKKYLGEEEQIDEISKKTLTSYLDKTKDGSGRVFPNSLSFRRSMESEVIAKAKLGKKPRKGKYPDVKIMADGKKLTKEDIVNRTLDKYMPEINEVEKLSEEEKIVESLVDTLSEAQIHTILDLYAELNEENKAKIFDVIATKEGINDLLDLAIQNRGE